MLLLPLSLEKDSLRRIQSILRARFISCEKGNKRDSAEARQSRFTVSFVGTYFSRASRLRAAPNPCRIPPRSGIKLENSRRVKLENEQNEMVRPFLFCPVAVIRPGCPLVLSRPGIKPRWHRCAGSLGVVARRKPARSVPPRFSCDESGRTRILGSSLWYHFQFRVIENDFF